MTRSSPGVKRIAAILDFMADHPAQSFALTDLVRALRLSRATCHALLTGLVEVGYLYRTSDKTYVLGPALAKVGRAAAQNMSPLQVAQPEMRALADEYDVVCTAFFLEGDTIVSRERAASISHVGYSIPLGTRVRLQPRSYPVYFSWLPEEAARRLDQAGLSADGRLQIEGAIGFARTHGFTALVRSDSADRAAEASDDAIYDSEANRSLSILTDVETDKSYAVTSITAPVFNAAGSVEFVIGLMGFTHSTMTGKEVFAAAASLRAACARIGAFIA